jgi:16S rRNA (uracil1498-N3)-methyltransferase
MTHRFFVPPESISGDTVTFDSPQAHQLRNVLRLTPGVRVIVLDNSGIEYEVELTALERDTALGQVCARQPSSAEPRVSLTLYQSPIKGDRFEWVLQKGTELGVSAFVPLICQRTLLRDPHHIEKKSARWERIICEAAEQSQRGRLPRLLAPLSFSDACHRSVREADVALFLWAGGTAVGLPATLRSGQERIALLIGPEGGFAPEEVSLAQDCGLEAISLGPRILRAETAGIVASAIALSALGEMG